MKAILQFIVSVSLSLIALHASAAPIPYFEDFEGYASGDTAVTNFTEVATGAWTIVAPSYSGKAYQDAISVFSSGVGIVAGENSSAGISFPDIASSSFLISTTFRIDSLTVTGADVNNTATIGLFARGADAIPASSNADRYHVSYFLDDDGLGHVTGRLWLREVNVFFGDSLNEVSAASLPITFGDIYQLTLSGAATGGSIAFTAMLTNVTTSSSISVSDTDGANLLTGSNFGYFNHVRVEDGGTVSLNADFDAFTVAVPEPATGILLVAAYAALFVRRRHRGTWT
jgi:hypothetical protein